MNARKRDGCPLHGPGVRPEHLVGRRLERVLASWHRHGSDAPYGPLDIWLVDSEGDSTLVTTGSDWCLIVESSAPFEGYDMRECGRVEVVPDRNETPFAARVGETVLAVREEWEQDDGRTALEIVFDSGAVVRCGSRAGDLVLSARGDHGG
ncbi:hypothetical protein [Streptomyces sp. NPDC014894]|uniref:hypothetical protein n=1 Tax=Streptomyces sp. NPDC014894 TaxID=3364931 RepID=UPI0036F7E3A0